MPSHTQTVAPLSTHILLWLSVADLVYSLALIGEAARTLDESAWGRRGGGDARHCAERGDGACALLAVLTQVSSCELV